MKIAIFYHLQVSGAKRVVYDHTRLLKELGHQVDIYTYNTPDALFDPGSVADTLYTYHYNPVSIPLPFIKRLSEDLSTFYLLKNLHRRIAQDIDAKGYDIVLVHTDKHTQAPFITGFLTTRNVYFCLEPLKMVYEYGLRTPDHLFFVNKIYESINRAIRKRIDRENARKATFSTAISYFGRELMIQAFDLYPKISYLGIDTTIFKHMDMKKKNQILFVGQKIDMNGYAFAQKAINRIPKHMRPELKVISWTNNKNERLTDTELVREYNESLMTLSLSNFDTFGLVPLESLACGTPVIAFNVAAYRETLVSGKTGFLIDFSLEELTEKIEYLLTHPKERIAMGTYGISHIKNHWTWKKHAKELEKLLQSFIAQ